MKIIFGLVGSVWLSGVLKGPFVFNGDLPIFLFSAAVGGIFEYFQSLKAARLDPIDALRYE